MFVKVNLITMMWILVNKFQHFIVFSAFFMRLEEVILFWLKHNTLAFVLWFKVSQLSIKGELEKVFRCCVPGRPLQIYTLIYKDKVIDCILLPLPFISVLLFTIFLTALFFLMIIIARLLLTALIFLMHFLITAFILKTLLEFQHHPVYLRHYTFSPCNFEEDCQLPWCLPSGSAASTLLPVCYFRLL